MKYNAEKGILAFNTSVRSEKYEGIRKDLNGKAFSGRELRKMFLDRTWRDLNVKEKIILAALNPYFEDDTYPRDSYGCDFDFPDLGIYITGQGYVEVEGDSEHTYKKVEKAIEEVEEKYGYNPYYDKRDWAELKELDKKREEELEEIKQSVEYFPFSHMEINSLFDEWRDEDRLEEIERMRFTIDTTSLEFWYVD